MWNAITLIISIVSLLWCRIQPSTDPQYAEWKELTGSSPSIFLTDITAFLSILYFSLGLFLLFYNRKNRKNQRNEFTRRSSSFVEKLTKFYKLNLPFFLILTGTVTAGFWALYLSNPKLLSARPSSIQFHVPFYKTLIDHSFGIVSVIVELFVYGFNLTIFTPIITTAGIVLYFTWICIYNSWYSAWPYTIFNNKPLGVVFLYCCAFLLSGIVTAAILLTVIRFIGKKKFKNNRYTMTMEV